MKKLLLVASLLALYQNWEKLERLFRPDAGKGEVVLYATSWCGYCQKTRELLAEEGIPYVEYDIEQSAQGRQQYQALSPRGVPVLTVGSDVVHGYDPKRIRALLP